jgi:hypothetical protein
MFAFMLKVRLALYGSHTHGDDVFKLILSTFILVGSF